MKNMLKSLALVAAGGALGFVVLLAGAAVTGARPWHVQTHPDVAVSAAIRTIPMTSGMQSRKMPEGMMKGGMGSMMTGGMAMCQQMMSGGMACPHQEMKSLAAKALTSFGAVEKEQNPTLLKAKLAELGTLLKQLQAKSEEKCPMMEPMQGQMQGGMSGEHQMGASPEGK
jgi:hypothetical protein